MKIIRQDEDGRIVIDGEGEEIFIDKGIPGDSPAVLTNFVFNGVGEISLFSPHSNNAYLSGYVKKKYIKKIEEIEDTSDRIISRFQILDL